MQCEFCRLDIPAYIPVYETLSRAFGFSGGSTIKAQCRQALTLSDSP